MTAIAGTTFSATFEIRLSPPKMTRAAQIVTIAPPITVAQVYDFSPIVKAMFVLFGSNAMLTADVIPLIWVIVPIPRRPAKTPKTAKRTASHFQFFPIPFSIV